MCVIAGNFITCRMCCKYVDILVLYILERMDVNYMLSI